MKNLKIFRSSKGVTLLEIMIVIVIATTIVIGLTIAYYKHINRLRDDLAKASLQLIFTQEKIYFLDEETFIGAADTDAVNGVLGLEIDISTGRSFNYSITASSTAFTAYAVKRDGAKTFIINQTGTIIEQED